MNDMTFPTANATSRRHGPAAMIGHMAREPQWWVGAILSIAGLIAVGLQLGYEGLRDIAHAAPSDPVFWLLFALYYLAGPACDWAIFRRLWRLPPSGFAALLRKNVANELVLGYSGEAQFYLWARRHAQPATSPFGAVKDVALLSAVAGSVTTLVLMAANWPTLSRVVAGPLGHVFAISAGVIALSSLVMFLLRKRLFSLPRADLTLIFAIHVLRIAAMMVLLALLCHRLLPTLPLVGLVALATMRMMLSRLPLLPAKDVMFAGLIAAIFGRSAPIVPVIALIGGLVIIAHVCVSLGLMVFRPDCGLRRGR